MGRIVLSRCTRQLCRFPESGYYWNENGARRGAVFTPILIALFYTQLFYAGYYFRRDFYSAIIFVVIPHDFAMIDRSNRIDISAITNFVPGIQAAAD